jgi:hypothetical protein
MATAQENAGASAPASCGCMGRGVLLVGGVLLVLYLMRGRV